MKHIVLFLAAVSLLLASCKDEKTRMKEKIAKLEKKSAGQNPEAADEKAQLCEQFAYKYPDDPEAPQYLMRAAQTYQTARKYPLAIALFDSVAARYPKQKAAGDALFYKGFVYENMMGDIPMARKSYEEFLRKYPRHPLAADTRKNLETLGANKIPDWLNDPALMNDSLRSQYEQDSLR